MVGPLSSDVDYVAEGRAALLLLAEEYAAVLEDAYELISLMRGLCDLDDLPVSGLLAQADQVGGALNEFRAQATTFPHDWPPAATPDLRQR